MNQSINIYNKFEEVSGFWHPAILAELNGQQVKIARIKGEFVMHHHEHEDEMFLVLKGSFDMVYPDHRIALSEGDMIVVPRGQDHQPVAEEEAWIMLFEPASTLNTGNVRNDMTREDPDRI